MAENANSVNDRLQQASQGGAPKLDPDQQRRYLGTFRERVSLVIPQSDATNVQARKALKSDMLKHKDYTLTIDADQLDDDTVAKYEQVALANNVKFTTEQDSNYQNPKFSYAIVFANPTEAINQSPVLWSKKYANTSSQDNQSTKSTNSHKSSGLWSKILSFFD